MIGVDLGLNVGSVIRIDKEGKVVDSLVLKMTDEKLIEQEHERLSKIALRFADVITEMRKKAKNPKKQKVAIEEPVYSWGRKNPKGFAKNVALMSIVCYILDMRKIKFLRINNKTAKMIAGGGSKDKSEMIKAYKKRTGNLPGHSTKYGQETLADSYFIALAGYEK